VMAVTLALGASVAWGASDFLGGLASRRLPVVVVLLGAQVVGLALAASVWLLSGPNLPVLELIALGAGAGIAELVGFAFLYRGLAIGEMTAVAPLAALAAVLPVAVAIGAGERIAGVQAAGMLLAIAGSALTSAEPGGRGVARGAVLGLGAALCFGAFFVLLGEAGEAGGPAAVLAGRAASVAALVLVIVSLPAKGARPDRRDGVVIAALGALDVAANLAYAGAALHGPGATTAVLASLYPITTVLLARAVLHERLGGIRLAGVAAVLGGVGLISVA
jgi:uncharacterized membrane protein